MNKYKFIEIFHCKMTLNVYRINANNDKNHTYFKNREYEKIDKKYFILEIKFDIININNTTHSLTINDYINKHIAKIKPLQLSTNDHQIMLCMMDQLSDEAKASLNKKINPQLAPLEMWEALHYQ